MNSHKSTDHAVPAARFCSPMLRSQIPISEESREGDVYRVEQEDLSGPWEVTNVLQPTVYENDKGERSHCLQVPTIKFG